MSPSNSPPVEPALVVRDSTEADVTSIQRIYAHYVLNALATFEETPPPFEEMIARRQKVLDLDLPYLVADFGGEILGYCYASAYHGRAAYRHTIEDSVYVANGLGGRGVGAALLGGLIARCEAGPWRQMIAIIGDSGNAASTALHRRFGFEPTGILRSVGFKFGRWVDTPFMQRGLGPGDHSLP